MEAPQFDIGIYEVEIVSHGIRNLGKSPAVVILVQNTVGANIEVPVWLTEKAMNMAYKSLKLCGFDAQNQDLDELQENPSLLAGKKTTIMVEEFNGRKRGQIMLDQVPTKGEMGRLQTLLRGVVNSADDELPY